MEHILQRIPPELRWQVLTSLLLTTLVLGWGFQLGKSPMSPPELVGLELARTPGRAKRIVEEWTRRRLIRSALIGVGLDYLFLLAYSNAMACGCAWYAAEFTGGFALTGMTLALSQWIAALCDMTENFYLLQMLLSGEGKGAKTCTTASLLKWVFVLAGLAYIDLAMLRRCLTLLPQHPIWGALTVIGCVGIATLILWLTKTILAAWRMPAKGGT